MSLLHDATLCTSRSHERPLGTLQVRVVRYANLFGIILEAKLVLHRIKTNAYLEKLFYELNLDLLIMFFLLIQY